MCGGSSYEKSASEIYDEKKKDYGDLPSLSMSEPVERSGPKYKSKRTGSMRRSLLGMIGGSSDA